MLNATLNELSAALAEKRISSVELTQLFLARIERLNAELNAWAAALTGGCSTRMPGTRLSRATGDGRVQVLMNDCFQGARPRTDRSERRAAL